MSRSPASIKFWSKSTGIESGTLLSITTSWNESWTSSRASQSTNNDGLSVEHHQRVWPADDYFQPGYCVPFTLTDPTSKWTTEGPMMKQAKGYSALTITLPRTVEIEGTPEVWDQENHTQRWYRFFYQNDSKWDDISDRKSENNLIIIKSLASRTKNIPNFSRSLKK